MKRILFFLLLLPGFAQAEVRLPRLFADHMVLQRNQPIRVWGWAGRGESVRVQLDGQTARAKAGSDGRWQVQLPARPAGGPYQLVIDGKNRLTINDIYLGEVWLCSGQSNMEFSVRRAAHAEPEIKAANYPLIRHFTVPHAVSLQPTGDVSGGTWQVCSPETVAEFSAVAYYFARELVHDLNVPIGLIHSSWGGTNVETWISRPAIENHPTFRQWLADMPSTLDSVRAMVTRRATEQITQKHGPLPADDSDWANPDFDDANWPTMNVPIAWERSALPGFDGRVWFRKEVTLPDFVLNQPMLLSLGSVNETDETYINGVRVGGYINNAQQPRLYLIDAKLLRPGKNVIAVRVDDREGDGGLLGKANQMTFSSVLYDFSVSLANQWKYHAATQSRINVASVGPNQFPTLLYNAMIDPVRQYGLAGVLWYQGESNAVRAWEYRQSFPLLIQDWRERFGQPQLPFLFVQLASYGGGNNRWAELREAQQMTLSLPKTGMAVTTDIGETDDIHPRNKQDVGKRLARQALRRVYGKPVVADGPRYASMRTEAGRITLSFKSDSLNQQPVSLVSRDPRGYLYGFEIAGSDQKFHPARAEISGQTVVVSSPAVPNPVAVRYAWSDDPHDANLFSAEGLPAAPFRTDDWPLTTSNVAYKVNR